MQIERARQACWRDGDAEAADVIKDDQLSGEWRDSSCARTTAAASVNNQAAFAAVCDLQSISQEFSSKKAF